MRPGSPGRAGKRDAEFVELSLTGLEQIAGAPDRDIVDLHQALLAFEAIDPRAAKVVELRFFVVGISVPTVKRDWALARAWLHRELSSRP